MALSVGATPTRECVIGGRRAFDFLAARLSLWIELRVRTLVGKLPDLLEPLAGVPRTSVTNSVLASVRRIAGVPLQTA